MFLVVVRAERSGMAPRLTSMRSRGATVLALGVVLPSLAACTGDEDRVAGRLEVRTPPGVVVDTTCGRSADGEGSDEGGGCNAGFALDSANYLFECVPVWPGSVSANQLGAGTRNSQPIFVRQIEGVDRAVAVAVGNNLKDCLAAGRRAPVAWVFAFPSRPVDGGGRRESVLCRYGVLDDPARKANRCPAAAS